MMVACLRGCRCGCNTFINLIAFFSMHMCNWEETVLLPLMLFSAVAHFLCPMSVDHIDIWCGGGDEKP